MIVYAIQWQNSMEPWGWESLILFSDQAVAVDAFEKTLVSLRNSRYQREDAEEWFRLISTEVFATLPDDYDPLDYGDKFPGVTVLRGSGAPTNEEGKS